MVDTLASVLLFIVSLASLHYSHGTQLGCQGSAGNAVDWWLIIKLPHGPSYLYTDGAQLAGCGGEDCWVRSDDINSDSSPLRVTLAPVADLSRTRHVLYNDEDDGGTEHFTYAHSKGCLGFERGGGFWVQHSFPRYPQHPASPQFSVVGRAQLVYGQHAFCASLNGPQINNVARALLTAAPYVYSYSSAADSQYPDVAALLLHEFDKRQRLHVGELVTVQGLQLLLLAKSGRLAIPMHEAGVEVQLNSSMKWETWRHGPSAMPAMCPPDVPFASVNVEHIRHRNTTWSSMQDHSKWGIGYLHSAAHVCVGDLNRERSQQHRGGGFVCMTSLQLWSAMRSLIEDADVCLLREAM
jgi:deoxyribonuclease II